MMKRYGNYSRSFGFSENQEIKFIGISFCWSFQSIAKFHCILFVYLSNLVSSIFWKKLYRVMDNNRTHAGFSALVWIDCRVYSSRLVMTIVRVGNFHVHFIFLAFLKHVSQSPAWNLSNSKINIGWFFLSNSVFMSAQNPKFENWEKRKNGKKRRRKNEEVEKFVFNIIQWQ